MKGLERIKKGLVVYKNNSFESVRQVFRVIVALLRTNQSKYLLNHLFATLQGLVNKFPTVLFQGSTEYCADLCEQVVAQRLHYCSACVTRSAVVNVRALCLTFNLVLLHRFLSTAAHQFKEHAPPLVPFCIC